MLIEKCRGCYRSISKLGAKDAWIIRTKKKLGLIGNGWA